MDVISDTVYEKHHIRPIRSFRDEIEKLDVDICFLIRRPSEVIDFNWSTFNVDDGILIKNIYFPFPIVIKAWEYGYQSTTQIVTIEIGQFREFI